MKKRTVAQVARKEFWIELRKTRTARQARYSEEWIKYINSYWECRK